MLARLEKMVSSYHSTCAEFIRFVSESCRTSNELQFEWKPCPQMNGDRLTFDVLPDRRRIQVPLYGYC